jgi:hypothetical protein
MLGLNWALGTPQQITYATMGANLTGFGNLSGFKPRILFLASSLGNRRNEVLASIQMISCFTNNKFL